MKWLDGRVFESVDAAVIAAEGAGFTVRRGQGVWARRGFLTYRLVSRRYGAFHEWVES